MLNQITNISLELEYLSLSPKENQVSKLDNCPVATIICDLSYLISGCLSMQFRKDINGLRAWAVAAVVLFHFGIPGFEGGFIGVDIFFVISGYLMTGIIVGGLYSTASNKTGRAFSLGRFYLARARRILPALLALCIVLLGAAWFLLGPSDYEILAAHAVRVVAFISNFKFWREAGYFDTASHEKWFLHTWSLSVEWQFYLLFPLILLAVWKLRPDRKAVVIALLTLFFSSLLLSIALTPREPVGSFFLLHTRAWEMVAGGLVYLYASRLSLTERYSRLLEYTGFAIIIASILLLDDRVAWPGHLALLPVAGTVLILLAAREKSWLSTSYPCQWLGKTSYSVYLWHWPLWVGLVYFQLQHHWLPVLAAFALTLILGWLSWAVIEQPSQKRLSKIKPRFQTVIIIGLVIAVALFSEWIRKQDGLHGRLSPEINAVFAEADNRNPDRKKCYRRDLSLDERCTYGGEELGIIVIGDSHAQSIVRSVEKALPTDKYHVLDWTFTSCPTIANVKEVGQKDACGKFVAEAVIQAEAFATDAPILIVNRVISLLKEPSNDSPPPSYYVTKPYSSWTTEYYEEIQQGLIATACAFAAHRPVYMLRPIPELSLDVPRAMGRALIRGEELRVSVSLEEYRNAHQRAWAAQDLAAEQCEIKLLDPLPYLCSDGHCWGDVDGLPIYYDDDHLNERGGELLVPLFRQILTQP